MDLVWVGKLGAEQLKTLPESDNGAEDQKEMTEIDLYKTRMVEGDEDEEPNYKPWVPGTQPVAKIRVANYGWNTKMFLEQASRFGGAGSARPLASARLGKDDVRLHGHSTKKLSETSKRAKRSETSALGGKSQRFSGSSVDTFAESSSNGASPAKDNNRISKTLSRTSRSSRGAQSADEEDFRTSETFDSNTSGFSGNASGGHSVGDEGPSVELSVPEGSSMQIPLLPADVEAVQVHPTSPRLPPRWSTGPEEEFLAGSKDSSMPDIGPGEFSYSPRGHRGGSSPEPGGDSNPEPDMSI
jgi:hypothetical protein